MGVESALLTPVEALPTRWKILLYGFPGSGKTTLAAQSRRPLIIEIDDGGATVLATEEFKHVKVYSTRDLAKLASFVKACRTDSFVRDNIDTIVLDTLSEAQTLERLRQVGDPTADGWKFNDHVYTKNNFWVNGLVRNILEVGKDTIFCCHMREESVGDERVKTVHVRPGLSPGPLKDILSIVDGAFFLQKEGNTRQLKIVAGTQTLTKSRLDQTGVPNKLTNPTFPELQKYLDKLTTKGLTANV